jgi:preprotein translocase subunit SecY
MWIGEQIDEYGIGNGISLLIMAGILARLPVAITGPNGLWYNSTSKLNAEPGKYGITTILMLIGLFIAVVVGVIAITESQRRIPTQSAKHVRGRRVYGGTKQFLPLKVNQAGVMPIIFASSLLIFPSFVFTSLERATSNLQSESWTIGSVFAGIFRDLSYAFQRQSYIYTVCYVILIYFFCYFWTAITFNPKDMAENLKDLGSFIPGYRPGRRTADYLEKVMLRITYVGAAFLALVAVIPSLVQSALQVDWTVASFLGGTGLLIVISVCLDLVQKIDGHLVVRSYSGLVTRK